MQKFTISIEKIKEGKYDIWSPSISQIVVQAKTEEEGIEELKKKIRIYLEEFPKDLEKFEINIKHIRLRRIKTK